MGMCALLVAACGGDSTGPSSSTAPLYWQLQLNHRAITLATVAPYDTIRLVATPVDVHGAPIATTARPVYAISDTSLKIDSTGLLRVHWSGSDALNITVAVALSTNGATLTDTAVVNIVHYNSAAEVPVFDSLVLRPVAGDSARRSTVADDTTDLPGQPPTVWGWQLLDSMVARTATGAAMANVLVRYQSSDTLIARFARRIGNGSTAPIVVANFPGVVMLTAEATIYGKRRVDSLRYLVGYPLRMTTVYGVAGISPVLIPPLGETNTLSLGTLTIGQGGAVLWSNSTGFVTDDSLDIVFDDPTHVAGLSASILFQSDFGKLEVPAGPGGNIAAFPAAVPQNLCPDCDPPIPLVMFDSVTSRARVFPQPGTYHWSSPRQGIRGTVIVISNDSILSASSQ
jgi:hypothetical protein